MRHAGLIPVLMLALGLAAGGDLAVSRPAAAAVDPAKAPMPADPYLRLRLLALRISAADIGPTATGTYGVVMDFQLDGRTATLVALSSGEASLYLSTGKIVGGGVVGGADPAVAKLAASWVAQAQADIGRLRPADDLAPPAPGQVRIFALTSQGLMAGDDAAADLAHDGRPLSEMFAAGRKLAAALQHRAPGGGT